MIHEPLASIPADIRESLDDLWARYRPMVQQIEERHARYDDAETPRLPPSVINGSRRLIDWLDDLGESPPTVMTGTCDATIVLEWHEAEGNRAFRSLDVLSDNEAEEYIKYVNGESVLRTVEF